ncbi:MBL fold metallo-hydrolase [Cohnella suwonensis]|uniref:MBL fold metallo-hydrolase n=1 Tax=Cohnella suwonensis TaxID=696072 RepID=A0ABW0M1T3_9BACL
MPTNPSIAVVPLSAPVMGRTDTVHLTMIWDENDVVLVDTGFPGQFERLRDDMRGHGVDPDRLNRILMTHQDIDHIGNLQALVESSPAQIEVYAHAVEKPYIEGDRRIIRFTDEAIASVDRMPESVPEAFKQGLKRLMLNPPKAKVQRVVEGGERLPLCGGVVVIDTPGHTPGHISYYHEPSKTLIAGDALTADNGILNGPDPHTTLDMATALASLANLDGLDIRRVVCYHGGIVEGDAQERLSALTVARHD